MEPSRIAFAIIGTILIIMGMGQGLSLAGIGQEAVVQGIAGGLWPSVSTLVGTLLIMIAARKSKA